jgi:hypothetical protein
MATLTFAKNGSATYTNETTTEAGTLTVTPAPALVPASLIGKTATIAYESNGKAKKGEIAFGYGTFTATNTTSSPSGAGTYTFMPITPSAAFVELTYTDSADAGGTETLQFTFLKTGPGIFVSTLVITNEIVGNQGPFTLSTTKP